MTEKTITKEEILNRLSPEELAELATMARTKAELNKKHRRAAYESIRADMVSRIENSVRRVALDVSNLVQFVTEETEAFRDVMAEYGMLRREGQMSYSLLEGDFKVEVKTNKVKKFDERADVAASRLIEFLDQWIADSEKGSEDPMYQLAMTLLERNKYGDLDYKSISKLYELEEKFGNEEYSAIMALFRESHLTEGTATNFYFWEKDSRGIWRKVEPSFNRL